MMEKIVSLFLMLIFGLVMSFAGARAILKKKIEISWSDASDDFIEKSGFVAVFWGVFFLIGGIYGVYVSLEYLLDILG
jgi:uncharacterized membrane protein YfcA